jgi:hypothetical protein
MLPLLNLTDCHFAAVKTPTLPDITPWLSVMMPATTEPDQRCYFVVYLAAHQPETKHTAISFSGANRHLHLLRLLLLVHNNASYQQESTARFRDSYMY